MEMPAMPLPIYDSFHREKDGKTMEKPLDLSCAQVLTLHWAI